MEKLKSITIKENEQYLRQISKKVDINDPELHNNEERKELRKKEGYEIISKSGNYDELKEG